MKRRNRKRKRIEDLEAANEWQALEMMRLQTALAFIEARRAAYPHLPDSIRLATPALREIK